jgi:hypothetical protein
MNQMEGSAFLEEGFQDKKWRNNPDFTFIHMFSGKNVYCSYMIQGWCVTIEGKIEENI